MEPRLETTIFRGWGCSELGIHVWKNLDRMETFNHSFDNFVRGSLLKRSEKFAAREPIYLVVIKEFIYMEYLGEWEIL